MESKKLPITDLIEETDAGYKCKYDIRYARAENDAKLLQAGALLQDGDKLGKFRLEDLFEYGAILTVIKSQNAFGLVGIEISQSFDPRPIVL